MISHFSFYFKKQSRQCNGFCSTKKYITYYEKCTEIIISVASTTETNDYLLEGSIVYKKHVKH